MFIDLLEYYFNVYRWFGLYLWKKIKEFGSGESVVVLIINDVVDIFSKVMFLFWIYKGLMIFVYDLLVLNGFL